MPLIGKQSGLSVVVNRAIREGSCQVVLRNINDNNEIHETCPSVTFYNVNNSLYGISRKCILPSMIRAVPALILIGEMHFLPMSEIEFFS